MENLKTVDSTACTTDCWFSLTQDTYTVTVHFIDSQWYTQTYTLTTNEMEERHTAENLGNELQNMLADWEITDKVVAMVTDNARNIKAGKYIFKYSDIHISKITQIKY